MGREEGESLGIGGGVGGAWVGARGQRRWGWCGGSERGFGEGRREAGDWVSRLRRVRSQGAAADPACTSASFSAERRAEVLAVIAGAHSCRRAATTRRQVPNPPLLSSHLPVKFWKRTDS